MATTGSLDVNLDKFSQMINNSSALGANVTLGVANVGDLIGLAIGLLIALTLLFAVMFLLMTFIKRLIGSAKGLRNAAGK